MVAHQTSALRSSAASCAILTDGTWLGRVSQSKHTTITPKMADTTEWTVTIWRTSQVCGGSLLPRYVPGEHTNGVTSPLMLHALPAGQVEQFCTDTNPATALHVPTGHGMHTLASTAPRAPEYVPAGHGTGIQSPAGQ
jgi:hypothetical protein